MSADDDAPAHRGVKKEDNLVFDVDALPPSSPEALALTDLVIQYVVPQAADGGNYGDLLVRFLPGFSEKLVAQGFDRARVEHAVRLFHPDNDAYVPATELTAISSGLAGKFEATFNDALESIPPGPERLDEKQVDTDTGFAMFLYPNESKHPGFPHVQVRFDDEAINIFIGPEPWIIAGKKDLRGSKAALKAVATHHKALKKEWDALRPDDQNLEKKRKAAAPRPRRKKKKAKDPD